MTRRAMSGKEIAEMNRELCVALGISHVDVKSIDVAYRIGEPPLFSIDFVANREMSERILAVLVAQRAGVKLSRPE